MKTIRLIIGISLVMLFVYPAWAAQRTFVSGLGSDANACSVTAPCRTFGAAIAVTNAGGEVIVVDSAGYGPVTINKSVSIIAEGVYAGISVFSGNGITISAGATDIVVLKGLSINGLVVGSNGIFASQVGTLLVENCSISGFGSSGSGPSYGIYLTAPNSNLIVRDSALQNNWIGVGIENSSGSVSAAIDRTRMDFNAAGFAIYFGIANATISNSTANNNTQNGYINYGAGKLNLESCVASNNGYGLNNGSGSSYISNCTFANNGYGVGIYGGTVYTLSNNKIVGNGTNVYGGSLTPVSQQ